MILSHAVVAKIGVINSGERCQRRLTDSGTISHVGILVQWIGWNKFKPVWYNGLEDWQKLYLPILNGLSAMFSV